MPVFTGKGKFMLDQNTTYNLDDCGAIVKERFDEATCRDEFEGDNICILHGLEKAMVGTMEINRTIEKDYTLADLEKWLDAHNFTSDCKVFSIARATTDVLTISLIKEWVALDDYRTFLFNRDFTEEVPVTVAVYERNLCIKCIADDYDDKDIAELHKNEYTEEELKNPDLLRELKLRDAEEFFEYNTIRALPYAHQAAPIILEGFDVDDDRWEAFKKACD